MFARVTFTRLVVHTEKPSSAAPEDAPLVVDVFFRLEVGDRRFGEGHAQVVCPDGDPCGELEVSPVEGSYRGPWNADDFRAHVERYVRDVVSTQGYRLRPGRDAAASVRECISRERDCWLEV